MEVKKIIENFETERENLLIDFTSNKIPMTELSIQLLVRLRSIVRMQRELGEIDKKIILKKFKVEKEKLTKTLLDERSPIPPTFMEEIHRLKILTKVITDLDDEALTDLPEDKGRYIG